MLPGMTGDLSELLDRWSSLVERIKYAFRYGDVPEPVLASDSVLVTGASSTLIEAAEERLGLRLPPSYRAFLEQSNGAYAGPVGLELAGTWGWRPKPPGPTSLLPVEAIGRAAFDDPFLVDLATDLYDPLPHGHSTLYQSRAGEVAYLNSPWSGEYVGNLGGHVYWSILIGSVSDPATMVLLNPMMAEATGEWELDVVHPDGGIRYPSFGAWLQQQVEKEQSQTRNADEARALLRAPDTPLGLRLGAVRDLLGLENDLDWLTANAEAGLTPGAGPGHQTWALSLLQWIDSADHGHRFARGVRRIIDDPDFAEVSVVEDAAASSDPQTPTVAEILARERPADTARIGSLPTSDLVDRYRVAPDPTITGHLTRRGHPLVCSPAEGGAPPELGRPLRRAWVLEPNRRHRPRRPPTGRRNEAHRRRDHPGGSHGPSCYLRRQRWH